MPRDANPDTPSADAQDGKVAMESESYLARLWRRTIGRAAAPEAAPPDAAARTAMALDEAHLLMDFLASEGRPPPPDIIAAVIAAARAHGTDAWTAEAEAAFWQAHGAVSALARPASAASVRWSFSARARDAGGELWALALALLLVIGVAHFQLATLEAIGGATARLSAGLTTAQSAHATASSAFEAAAARGETEATLAALRVESERLDREQLRLRAEIGSQFDILADLWIMSGTGLFDAARVIDDPERQHRYLFAHGATLAGLMASFVLPGLYGILGALAFVLRRHQTLARARALTGEDGAANLLRLVLGALAGIAIGLFMRPEPGIEPLPGFTPLTPLALAFLAGYAVELLFTGMDRVVAAFSGPREPGPPH